MLADASVALMAIVVVASAFIRLARPDLACAAASDCIAGAVPASALAEAVGAARGLHRIAAAGVGLALLALTAAATARRPRDGPAIAVAVTALAVTIVLAAVGARGAKTATAAAMPGIAFVNATGGLALLALLWRLRVGMRGGTAPATPATRLAALLALALTAAWIGAEAAVATGLAQGDAGRRIVHLAIAGLGASALVACALLAVGPRPHRALAATIASLVAAATATSTIVPVTAAGESAGAIAPGLARVVIAASLLGALVSAVSAPVTVPRTAGRPRRGAAQRAGDADQSASSSA